MNARACDAQCKRGLGTLTDGSSELASETGVVLAKDAAGTAVVAQRRHEPRVRRRLIRPAQGVLHVPRHGSRDQQQIGVRRTCDEADAEPFAEEDATPRRSCGHSFAAMSKPGPRSLGHTIPRGAEAGDSGHRTASQEGVRRRAIANPVFRP